MNQTLQYRGYTGSIEVSIEDNLLHGKVLDFNGLISYEGTTIEELIADFHEAIDDYLEQCEANGITPQQPQASQTITIKQLPPILTTS